MRETSTIHIAYADDHVAVRKGIVALIQQTGGVDVVMEASNGAELIQQMRHAQNLPDVILLDINMPEMNGFETQKEIKAIWPEMKSIAFTALNSETSLIRMINLGVNGYLLKSCHPDEIKYAVQSVYKHGYYYSDVTEKRLFKNVLSGKLKLPHFSDNETEYLKYCPTDLTYSQIADKMGTTVKAVEGYRDRLCEKLHLKGRVSLAMYSVQFGFADMDQVNKAPIKQLLH